MANPRDAVPTDADRVNPEFPTISRPDPENPVIAQQAVRVGEHERLLADEAAHPEKRVDAANARVSAAKSALAAAQDAVKAAEDDAKRIVDDRHGEEPVDFGDPAPARPMGTAKDAKDFLDSNNILTEEQAERRSSGRASGSPGDEVASPSKQPMNPVTKSSKK